MAAQSRNIAELENASVWRLLIQYSLPSIAGMVVYSLYLSLIHIYLFIRLPRSKRFQHPAFRIRQKRAIFKIPDIAAPHFQHQLHARGLLEGNQPHHAIPASRAGDQACARPAPETAEGADQDVYKRQPQT